MGADDVPTFGALAVGDFFEWRDTVDIKSGPPGPEPLQKTSSTRYEWSRGFGTAEPHYPVRRLAPGIAVSPER